MSTDLLWRLERRPPVQHMKSHGEPVVREPTNDRSSTIVARLVKAYAEVVQSCSNDNRASHVGTDASVQDWNLASSGCYSNDGVHYVQVRVLSTIPTFVGLDTRNYSLQKDDVLFIPYENAQVLYARGLVVPAEPFVGRTSDHNAHRLREEDTSVSSDAP